MRYEDPRFDIGSSSVGGIVLAVSRQPSCPAIMAGVRVGRLGVDASVLFDVRKGFIHISAIASQISLKQSRQKIL